MTGDEKEERLIGLLTTRRSDFFWAGQRARIMAAVAAKPGLARGWILAPAAAIAVLIVVVLVRAPSRPPMVGTPVVSTAFLEHLDMLDDMDVLEEVREGEL